MKLMTANLFQVIMLVEKNSLNLCRIIIIIKNSNFIHVLINYYNILHYGY